MGLRFQIALFNGFDEMDVFGPYEILSVPGATEPRCYEEFVRSSVS